MIPADDRGLTLGDGLFETVLAETGRARNLPAHLERLANGCALLHLPPPEAAAVTAAVEQALAAEAPVRAAVRITWTAGSGGRGLDRPERAEPRLLVTTAPAPRSDTPARLHLSGLRRNAQSPLCRCKSLSYLENVLARREARTAGADEALLLDTDGRLSGAAAANLFWVADGVLFTPAPACGVLAGTMRAQVLAAAAVLGVSVREVEAGPDALDGAEALFLTNALIGVRPAGWTRPAAPHRLVEALAVAVS